jgi:hypothetical protein
VSRIVFDAHARKAEEERLRVNRTHGGPPLDWGFRLALALSAPPFGAPQVFASAGSPLSDILLNTGERQKAEKAKAKGTGETKEKSNQRLTVGQMRTSKWAKSD